MTREKGLDWSRVYGETELYRAAVSLYTKPLFRWRKAMSTSTDGQTFYDFAARGMRNLQALHTELRGRRFAYRPGLALHKNFNGKQRTLHLYPWKERLVDLLLYRVLNRVLDRWFSTRSYAYRIGGYGVDRCQREIRRATRAAEGPLYVIKRDIVDYFASIDHAILLDQLRGLVARDDYLFELLEQRVRFRFEDGGEQLTADRGVPFGTAIACLFANIHLTPLDRKLEAHRDVAAFRYADDLLVLSPDVDAARAAAETFAAELTALRLQSKPKSERNLVLGPEAAPSSGFEAAAQFRHLGLEFRADGSVGLSRDKFRKICNLFRYGFRRRRGRWRRVREPERRAALAIDVARSVLDSAVRNVAIIDYYLRHVSDEEQLRRLDRWLAEEILSIAFGGHKKGHFRKLPFQRLRSMGLPSLRHRRRLILQGVIESPFFVWQNERHKRLSRDTKRCGGSAARSTAAPADRSAFSRCPEAVVDQTS